MKNKGYEKFWREEKVHYGRCTKDVQKASGDKFKNNNMQMKHLMDSFEAQRETKMAKKKINEENGTKMNSK